MFILDTQKASIDPGVVIFYWKVLKEFNNLAFQGKLTLPKSCGSIYDNFVRFKKLSKARNTHSCPWLPSSLNMSCFSISCSCYIFLTDHDHDNGLSARLRWFNWFFVALALRCFASISFSIVTFLSWFVCIIETAQLSSPTNSPPHSKRLITYAYCSKLEYQLGEGNTSKNWAYSQNSSLWCQQPHALPSLLLTLWRNPYTIQCNFMFWLFLKCPTFFNFLWVKVIKQCITTKQVDPRRPMKNSSHFMWPHR